MDEISCIGCVSYCEQEDLSKCVFYDLTLQLVVPFILLRYEKHQKYILNLLVINHTGPHVCIPVGNDKSMFTQMDDRSQATLNIKG